MGSSFNFKNLGNDIMDGGGGNGGGRLPGNYPLARQSSVYSLTFDEFQNTMGGSGKDFGSMNMDELLKNIWSAEEIQSMGTATGAAVQDDRGVSGGYLQRQGSLTLPRTLSQKTVDEVWREFGAGGGKDANAVGGSSVAQTQRQPTLGEVTLEEFLVRAGVVREEAQLAAKSTNTAGLFGDFSRTGNNQGLGFAFQQPGMMGGRILESSNQISAESANLPLNGNGVRSNQHQLVTPQQTQQPQKPQLQLQPQQQQHHQQPIFPKQPALAYGGPMAIPNGAQLGSPSLRAGIVGVSDHSANGNLVQNAALQGGGMGNVGLGGAGGVTVASGSPAVSSDGFGKGNGDVSSVSPLPYAFNGGLRGRKSGPLEKVVERRHRRMIKNRESAARSRARKQAYTMELEGEIAKLKEENEELRKKQEEIMEMQKNQVMEMMNMQQRGGKRRCLRRTQTGPW